MSNSRLKPTPTVSAKHPDALALLRSELDGVTTLFDQFENARSAARKKAIVQKICIALTVHAQLEDELVYPAFRRVVNDAALVPRARQQQAILRSLIAEVQGIDPGEDAYDANVRLMSEHVRHHVEEQNQIFPKTRSSPKLDMTELGEQIATRKQELLAAIRDFGGWD
jgi:hemerythrin superfamily protein